MRKLLIIFASFKLFASSLITPILMDIDKIQIEKYLVSEKLDGLRGYWTGEKLISKNQNKYNPPKEFLKGFPPFEIDGELYCGKEFEKTLSDIRSGAFKCAKLYVFEVPNQKGNLEQRLQVLKDYLAKNPNENIKIIPQLHFKNKKEFYKYFDELTKNGAEGVVLHKKDTEFSTKKGDNIIKFKKYHKSSCKITKINYTNELLKNYECNFEIKNVKNALITNEQKKLYEKLKNNNYNIKIGSGFSKTHRQNPLKIGLEIEFKYYKISKNLKPIHAVFMNVKE